MTFSLRSRAASALLFLSAWSSSRSVCREKTPSALHHHRDDGEDNGDDLTSSGPGPRPTGALELEDDLIALMFTTIWREDTPED
ncbi:hypothetical protein EYF80_066331 [Liparis tanakae]|uniref:Secreted protein n=1 Tax=Liparis tanakae TaxID=230148 RepID=A0A4Z2E3M9_9TELE|nr:hypothetical protein EYF80_066331 [Liparis tanakae]